MKIKENNWEFELGDYKEPGEHLQIQLSEDEKHARVLVEGEGFITGDKEVEQLKADVNAELGFVYFPIALHGGYMYFGPKEELAPPLVDRAGSMVTPAEARRYDLWKAILEIKANEPAYLEKVAEGILSAVEERTSRVQLAGLLVAGITFEGDLKDKKKAKSKPKKKSK